MKSLKATSRLGGEYHLAAEKIDGHYPIGRIPSDILSWAASAGYKAMRKVDPSMRARSNKGANVEALRRLEREGLIISESEKIRRHRG